MRVLRLLLPTPSQLKQAHTLQYLPKLAEFLLTEKVAGYGCDQKQKLIRDDLADRKALAESQLNGHVTARRDDTRAGLDAKLLGGCGLNLRPGHGGSHGHVTKASRGREEHEAAVEVTQAWSKWALGL